MSLWPCHYLRPAGNAWMYLFVAMMAACAPQQYKPLHTGIFQPSKTSAHELKYQEDSERLTTSEFQTVIEILREQGFKGKPDIRVEPATPTSVRSVYAQESEQSKGREVTRREFRLNERFPGIERTSATTDWRVHITTQRTVMVEAKGAMHKVAVPDDMNVDEVQALVDAFMAIKHDRIQASQLDLYRKENPSLVPVRIVRCEQSHLFTIMIAQRHGYEVEFEDGEMKLAAHVGINL